MPDLGPAAPPAPVVDDADRLAISFVRSLRDNGVVVPLGSAISYFQALGELDVDRASSLYWAGWDPLESTCRHASLSIL